MFSPLMSGPADAVTTTELLLRFEGANGATTTIDTAGKHSPVLHGNAQISTADARSGTSSLLLDGTGDYVSLADSPAWSPSAWTCECFARNTVESHYHGIMAHDMGTGNQRSWRLAWSFTAKKYEMYYSPDGTNSTGILAPTTSVTTAWTHYAVSYNGTIIRGFAGGVMIAKATSPLHNSTAPLVFGARSDGSNGWRGYVDECRFHPACLYNSDNNFTPPAPPLLLL